MCVENEELTKVANDSADFFDEPLKWPGKLYFKAYF